MKISTTLGLHLRCPGKEPFSVMESVKFLIDAGFEVLDFSFSQVPLPDGTWRYTVSEAVDYAASRGVAFLYAHVPYNFPKEFTPENKKAFDASLYRAVEAAAFAGIRYAVMHAYTNPVPVEEYNEETEQRVAIEMLSPYFEFADRKGCALVIENMRHPKPGSPTRRYLTDLGELCRLCDALGGRGVCLDTGHAHTVGMDTPEQIAKLGSRLKMLHINDNFAAGDDHLPPFCGTVNWSGVMDGLKAAGYEGDFNYEVNASRVPPELREQNAAYLLAAARYLIGYMENR